MIIKRGAYGLSNSGQKQLVIFSGKNKKRRYKVQCDHSPIEKGGGSKQCNIRPAGTA